MSRGEVKIPEPSDEVPGPFKLNVPGWWLVLSDLHIPYHDVKTIELAVAEARKHQVKGVVLNGDLLDCYQISRFDKDPTKPKIKEEILKGRQFLAYLREKLPKARVVLKEGNHEERLYSYLFNKAPELFELDVISWPTLLDMSKYRVDHVGEKRVIQLGRLNVIHGHEYRPAIQVPVNAARGLFLRAKSVALCGHWHQTSEHHEPNITGKAQGAWSIGCACGLKPLYSPLNKWNHGFAMVEVAQNGEFCVRNLRVLDGKVL